MKNGLFFENDELIYYKEDVPKHAGVIQIDDAIYYIGSKGRAVKGEHVVHRAMSNGILDHGTYKFGDDYKLIEGSYIAPKKIKQSKSKERKNRKIKLLLVSLSTALLAALIVGMVLFEVQSSKEHEQVSGGESNDISAQFPILLPDFEEDVLLCTEAAKRAYDGEITVKDALADGNPYRPFIFEYNLWNRDGILLLSEDPELSNAQEFVLDGKVKLLSIDNLKTGTKYYYMVKVGAEEYPGSFETAQSTRFISIPGIVNTRDIGGRVTLDGKTVKQGLLIRGTEMDALASNYLLAMNKQDEVQNAFGFVYDMDLREKSLYNGIYHSPLGADVGHMFYEAPQYGYIFNAAYAPALRQIFADLANPAHYPMYLHCTWGQDRTGTIVFLLQGILNVSLEDMIHEYRTSGYVNHTIATSDQMDAVIRGLDAYEGDTIQEKIVYYLTEFVGVTNEEIEMIRKIYLSE